MKNAPWYDNADKTISAAAELIAKLRAELLDGKPFADKNPKTDPIQQFSNYLRTKLVFESNLIEGAGASYGETKRIIESHFPELPSKVNVYDKFVAEKGGIEKIFTKSNLHELEKKIEKEGVSLKAVIPSVKHGEKSRSFKEVSQHYQAIGYAFELCESYGLNKSLRFIRKSVRNQADTKKRTELKSALDSLLKAMEKSRLRKEDLITKTKLKTLHRLIASGLLPDDCKSHPGDYRKEMVFVENSDISFPPHSLVESTMDRFFEEVSELLDNATTFESVLTAAATISYKFVAIHPFPDFNGRLSRILLNMVLWSHVPAFTLAVSLRRDARTKQKYFFALRRANRGNLTPMKALIAREIILVVGELEKHFENAGLKLFEKE